MSDSKKRYYRKNVELFVLLNKMKLWPARSGVLHGIKSIESFGKYAVITTRWLRNKWAVRPCKQCRVPEWKLEKYSKTFFDSHYGSDLIHK